MKRILICVTLVGLLITIPITGYAQSQRVSLLAGSFMPGTSKIYPITVALIDFMRNNSNMDITIKSFAGSDAILQAVAAYKIQLASSAKSDTAASAFYGEDSFAGKPQKSLRAVINFTILQQTWITVPPRGIKTIPDLKGKKLPRYTAIPNTYAWALLKVHGIDPEKDIETVPLPNSSAAYKELGMGRLDAAHTIADHRGALALKEQFGRVVVVPIPPEKLAEAAAKDPSAFRGSYTGYIKPGQISWIDVEQPVPVMESPHTIYSNNRVADDIPYTFVKVMLDKWKEIGKLGAALKVFGPELIQKPLHVPYHPGAVKAFKEKGMWTEEMEKAHLNALKSAD